MPNHSDPRWSKIMSQQEEALERGNIDEVRRIRREGFNLHAEECRKSGDQISIHLMCCIEEAERLGLQEADLAFDMLLAFHSLKIKEGSMLNIVCKGILPVLGALMDECRYKLQILELERS